MPDDASSSRLPKSRATAPSTPLIAAVNSDPDHIQANGSDPGLAAELDRRLREQVALNSELDAEVRYLQAELAVKNEYLEELEIEIGRLHLVAAEYSAYRSRMTHRSIDGLVVRVQRLPGVYSPMRSVGRTMLRRYSRAEMREIEAGEE